MSSVNAPTGLVPALIAGGNVDNTVMVGTIQSTYATTIGEGDLVKLVGGYLVRAAATDASVGVLAGVQYTDTTGRRVDLNYWPASTVGTLIVAYYTQEPYIIYEIQCNAPATFDMLGQQGDIVATAPNATTGLSAETLNISSLSNSANKQLVIVGITPGPDNAWGDLFTRVLVRISKHQLMATFVGIA